MNTPKPCDVCKKLYTNVMFEDDPSYLSECKEGRELGNMNCVGFIHWNEKRERVNEYAIKKASEQKSYPYNC